MGSLSNDEIKENDLLFNLRKGNQRAFEKVYEQYSSVITANLLYLVKSKDLAQEVTQETFVALWENREGIDSEKSIKAYLFKIATNKTFNLIKRAKHDKALRQHLLPVFESGYSIDSYIHGKDNLEFLHTVLDKMPPKQREVFTLFKIEGYTYQQIAEQLGISHSTINTHLNRANQFIQSTLKDNPELLMTLIFISYITR